MITLESLIKMREPTNHKPESERSKTKKTVKTNPVNVAILIKLVKQYTRIQRKELINQSGLSRGTVSRIISDLEAKNVFKVDRKRIKSINTAFISMMSQ